MDKGSIFFAFVAIWYFNRYGISPNLFVLISNLYRAALQLHDVAVIDNIVQNVPVEEPVIKVRYEDKYLAEIRQLEKEFKFDENDEAMVKKTSECLKVITDSFANRRKEIGVRLHNIATELSKYDDNTSNLEQLDKQSIQLLTEERDGLLEEDDTLKNSMDTDEGKLQNNNQAAENARQFMINCKLDKLKNCHVMEHTPVGNVLMIYDKERETFKYYSDNTIPYRYLDVVARKYVKFFDCRPIFINTEEEIQLAEKKNEQAKREKEEKEAADKKRRETNHKPVEEKKRVFAKFKSYNKEAGTGHVSTGAPPKNSGPSRQPAEKPENDAVLKERANRYTYEGKMANFSFIKKIDRKIVDKKLAMTFADFKKMGLANKR